MTLIISVVNYEVCLYGKCTIKINQSRLHMDVTRIDSQFATVTVNSVHVFTLSQSNQCLYITGISLDISAADICAFISTVSDN